MNTRVIINVIKRSDKYNKAYIYILFNDLKRKHRLLKRRKIEKKTTTVATAYI